MTRLSSFFLTSAVAGWCGVASAFAQAFGVLDFVVDAKQTQITAEGTVAGLKVQEQKPGSLTAAFQGTLRAVVDGSTIRFPGGSTLDAIANGEWQPKPGGDPGTAPGDFAGLLDNPFTPLPGAFRNVVLDVTSEPLPLQNGTFSADRMVFVFPNNSAASFDFNAGFLGSGSVPLAGVSTNQLATGSSLVTAGSTQTLTLGVEASYRFSALRDNDSLLVLKGRIVAVYGGDQVRIRSIRIDGQKILLTVEGLPAEARVEGSQDLRFWTPRSAVASMDGDLTVFQIEKISELEFYRIVF